MKTIYFVRHGETENNAARRFNAPDTPLSEKGRKQAEEIAERCSLLSIDLVISSSLKRAQQTAAIVGEKNGMEFESSDLFVEGRYASRSFGNKVESPEMQSLIKEYHKSFSIPGFRFEDGENFDDLKGRALMGLGYLKKRPEKNILVVSHGFFMWIIAAAAVFGERLSAEECTGVIRGFDLMENTGLTVLTYDAPPRKSVGEPLSKWQLKVWNDHAHLG